MMRRVDETCSADIQDGIWVVLDVPGCIITRRLRLDRKWWRALEQAFLLCAKPARSMWERRRNLAALLDTYELQRLERQIIWSNAMCESEA